MEEYRLLDYKDIIIRRYVFGLTGAEIARQLNISKSGVNDFLKAFDACEAYIYTYEQRMADVNLLIKYGQKVALVIREL